MSTTDPGTGGELSLHERREEPLSACVESALNRYFRDLDGHTPPGNLYELVMNEVEYPLLKTVLAYASGNQSKAAAILGINRGTLRKRLEKHGLL